MTVRLQEEQDVERLRQAALLLEAENRRLTSRILELTRELLTARGEAATALQLRLTELERQLANAQAALFSPSTEKRPSHKRREREETEPQRGHGPREQPQLPLVEVVHHLDTADMQCPACGGALAAMEGCFEDSEEVDVLERRFVLKKHRRQKYRCHCNACVETAPGPEKLQVGGRYSIGFAVEVAAAKYLDHMPLERQVRVMAREGLVVDSQTLFDQLSALAAHLTPTLDALHAYQLLQPLLGADETRWPLLGSAGQARWHMWALASPSAVVYRVAEGRGADAARELLKGYSGVLMTDGYAVYDALAAASGGRFAVAHCWAHVRRKLMESQAPQAEEALALIAELYALEKQPKTGPPRTPEELLALRAEKSRDVLLRLHAWAMRQRVLPESGLGRALNYMGNLWPGLTRFVKDARVPLDNNATERALRGPVVGRKNHYGSKSRRGTEVAALFYSLLESAKLCGLEPKAYLRAATLAALRGEPPLLPHQAAERAAVAAQA